MRTLKLSVSDHLYDILLAMLKGLPEKDIQINEVEQVSTTEKEKFDINELAGTVKWPVDGLTYQKEIRKEWDREWDK